MRYKEFGKTGLKISEMTLGCWGMGGGGAWDDYDEDVRIDAVQAAIDCGINMVDTAACYNDGASERFLGRAIEKLGARDKLYITTKTGNKYVDGSVYKRDGRYDTIIEMTEQSLDHLRTDYVDLMLIHWPDVETPFEETMRALNDLKADGKIRHIGVSNFTIEQMQEAGEYGEIEVFQPPFSMLDLSQKDRIDYAVSKGMGVMTYGSLGGGMLTGAYRELQSFGATDSRNRFYKHFHEPMFSNVQKLLGVMDEISAANGNVPLSQIALNWSSAKPFVSTCIVGSQTREKVEQNAAAFNWTLSADDQAKLDEAVAAYQAAVAEA